MVIRNDEQIREIRGSLENLIQYFSEDRSSSVDSKMLLELKSQLTIMECKLRIYTDDYRLPRKSV
ncbi:MAG: hypothetical protein EBT03_09990 [Betaproteobacteria bacterium]|nr:hypothetical protein [Betaproteobacteria bacterium]NCA17464.1 hypothetical protein [Betaproteobacteria bacterium]